MITLRIEPRQFLITAVLVAVLSACGSDDPGSSSVSANAMSLALKLDKAPPSASDAVVVWSVSSGSPDYAYLWGKAAVNDTTSRLELKTRPPAEAINSYGLGVGIVVIAPRSDQLHEGKQTDPDEGVLGQAFAASERHAIIYVDHERAEAWIAMKTAGATPDEVKRAHEHWLFDFPNGYACGEGRDAPAGETFDSYVPVDCDELKIRSGSLDDLEFPNWT